MSKNSQKWLHKTAEYKIFGRDVAEPATLQCEKRHDGIDSAVMAGGCTLAQAREFGAGLAGMRRVARGCRLGWWTVPGFVPESQLGKASSQQTAREQASLRALAGDIVIQPLIGPSGNYRTTVDVSEAKQAKAKLAKQAKQAQAKQAKQAKASE